MSYYIQPVTTSARNTPISRKMTFFLERFGFFSGGLPSAAIIYNYNENNSNAITKLLPKLVTKYPIIAKPKMILLYIVGLKLNEM